ncbi:cytochrome C oxidase subunit III [Hyalangium versicolor]|uniref:cytochrome C oxidase subunit III n=1 Tax=Hyalangium versicolor TaxID=2861190 RepID=UPI001CCF85CC|nr:cytochrome C oxidase subunit III [Hyalangium versicolor]
MTPGQAPVPATRADEVTAWFGVVVGLGAWAMFFAALAFSVGYLRMREPWPLLGMPALPTLLPLVAVLLLGAAGVLLHLSGRAARVTLFAAGALGAWVASLAVQGFVLSTLWSAGLQLPQGGAQASMVYGLGAVHGAHVVVGLLGVVRELVRGARGTDVHAAVRLWGIYGAFLAVTGLILFGAVYLP